jgi:hypothetical protein
MRQVMVRCKVKPRRVEENEVRAVYEELKRAAPAATRYGDRFEDGPVVTEVTQIGSYDGNRS